MSRTLGAWVSMNVSESYEGRKAVSVARVAPITAGRTVRR